MQSLIYIYINIYIYSFIYLFIIILIIIINNIYTGLLVQDKYPVIIQGPVEQKILKAYEY